MESEKEDRVGSKAEDHVKITELSGSTSPMGSTETHRAGISTAPEHTTLKLNGTKAHRNKTATTRKDHKRTDSTSELPECDELEV